MDFTSKINRYEIKHYAFVFGSWSYRKNGVANLGIMFLGRVKLVSNTIAIFQSKTH